MKKAFKSFKQEGSSEEQQVRLMHSRTNFNFAKYVSECVAGEVHLQLGHLKKRV